jgi:hypothetical protein
VAAGHWVIATTPAVVMLADRRQGSTAQYAALAIAAMAFVSLLAGRIYR